MITTVGHSKITFCHVVINYYFVLCFVIFCKTLLNFSLSVSWMVIVCDTLGLWLSLSWAIIKMFYTIYINIHIKIICFSGEIFINYSLFKYQKNKQLRGTTLDVASKQTCTWLGISVYLGCHYTPGYVNLSKA